MSPTCPKCGGALWRNGETPAGKPRWRCGTHTGKHCYTTTNPKAAHAMTQSGKQVRRKAPVFNRSLKTKRRVLVTAAQNATPIHKGFLSALEAYADKNDAEIVAVPIRYKNPTSRWAASQANAEEWDPALAPYLLNTRKKLNKSLILLGDVKTQPTATSPLTGFEAITHGESGILAHTKLQLKTVPTPQHRLPKILTTTGAVTLSNYTDSKAGKLGEFHHTLGAALVEIDGSRFHLRQINADKDSGAFTDLTMHYGPGVAVEANPALALNMGDTHRDFILPSVEHATFGPGGMVETLRPRTLVWHDLNDNYGCNPHHGGNVFIALAKIRHGRVDIRAELERACQYVVDKTPSGCTSVIVPSNHNEFLARWILNTDPRTVPSNLKFWCETAMQMADATRMDLTGTVYPDPFVYWAKRLLAGQSNVVVLERGESYMIGGIEVGLHFDKGPNGARGSLKNLRRIGVKVMGGHGHGPGIDEGGMQVGTSTGPLEYGRGSPSGWMNTHGVIYDNCKRSLLNIVGRQWRLT